MPSVSAAYVKTTGTGSLWSTISPNNPEAGNQVQISLGSYTFNIDSCNISWNKNGVVEKEGIGEKFFYFTMGEIGQTTKINASVICPNNPLLEKSFLFQSNNIDLLPAAQTYTPVFYKGNSIATAGSQIRIVALPQIFDGQGKTIRPETLIYSWKKEGKPMTMSSGYGKNKIDILSDNSKESINIELNILSSDGEIRATKSISIPIEKPKTFIYANTPLAGIQYQKKIAGDFELKNNEIGLIAEPFFQPSSDVLNNSLVYSWSMNNKKISEDRNIIIRQESGQEGESIIDIQTKKKDGGNLITRNQIKIKFGQNSFFNF